MLPEGLAHSAKGRERERERDASANLREFKGCVEHPSSGKSYEFAWDKSVRDDS